MEPPPRGRLTAGFEGAAGAAGSAGAERCGVGEIGQASACAAGDAGGDGRGLQKEDRAEQAERDEDQAAHHRIGALDRAPLIAHERQDQLKDDDDQGEQDEIVHRLGQPAEEEAAGRIKQGAGDEDRTQGDQKRQGQLGHQHDAEAEGGRQSPDDEDAGRHHIRPRIEGGGVARDVLAQPGGIGEEFVERRTDAGNAFAADRLGQGARQPGEQRLGDEGGIGVGGGQGVEERQLDRAGL